MAGLLAFAPVPLGSQALVEADAGFDERFLTDARSAPTFTRPEFVELFGGGAWSADGEEVASASPADEADRLGYSGPLALSEPKGPTKILKDLLNTPVKELLVSRAEAGPDVPPPEPERATPPPPTAAETEAVPVRAADPVAERPPADIVAALPAPPVAAPMTPPAPPVAAPITPSAPAVAAPVTPPAEPRREPSPIAQANDAPSGRGPDVALASPAQPGAEPRAAGAEEAAPQGRRIAGGRASWYQHAGRTASGERFDPNRLTAAHRTLPFGARVRVVNERTNRSVVVRINDRVPRTARVVIDLSRASAKAVGLEGVGRVSLYQLDGAAEAPRVQRAALQAPAPRKTERAKVAHKHVVQRPAIQKRAVSAEGRKYRPAASMTTQMKPSVSRVRLAARASGSSRAALLATRRQAPSPEVEEDAAPDREDGASTPVTARY